MRGSLSRVEAAAVCLARWRASVHSILVLEVGRRGPTFRPNVLLDAMQRGMLRRLARQVDLDLARCLDYAVGTDAGESLRRFAEDLALATTIYERDHFEQSVHQHEAVHAVLKRMETTLDKGLEGLKARSPQMSAG